MTTPPAPGRRKIDPRTDRILDLVSLACVFVVLALWVVVEPLFILPILFVSAVTVSAVSILILVLARRRRLARSR